MDRARCTGKEHKRGDLAMSEQGMVSKTTTNPRNRACLLPQHHRMLTAASSHGVGTGGWEPALTVGARNSQSSKIKEQNLSPSSEWSHELQGQCSWSSLRQGHHLTSCCCPKHGCKALSSPSQGQAPAALLLISQIPIKLPTEPGDLTAKTPQDCRSPPQQPHAIPSPSSLPVLGRKSYSSTSSALHRLIKEGGFPKVQRPICSSSPVASPPSQASLRVSGAASGIDAH